MQRESIKYINRLIELINLGDNINIKMRLHHLKNIIEDENVVLPQANVMSSLPSHIDAGIEAKRYADMMNSKGEFNGFHELDFYNGTVWLRQMIEGNEA